MEITCKACGQRLRVADNSNATAIRCSRCKDITRLNGNNAPQATSAHPARSVATPKPASVTNAALSKMPSGTTPVASVVAKKQIACPGCQKQLALPSSFTAGKIKCPHCQAIVSVGTPAGSSGNAGSQATYGPSTSTAPYRLATQTSSQSSSAANGGSSLFDDLPAPSMPSTYAQPAGFGSSSTARSAFGATTNPYAPTAAVPTMRPAVNPSYVASASGMSSTGPGVLLLIQSLFTLGICILALGMLAFVTTQVKKDPNAGLYLGIHVAVSVASMAYQGIILGGAVQMIRGRNTTYGKAACIIAIIPLTFLTQGICFGFFLYPLALGGGIWGLVALNSRPPT